MSAPRARTSASRSYNLLQQLRSAHEHLVELASLREDLLPKTFVALNAVGAALAAEMGSLQPVERGRVRGKRGRVLTSG